MATMGIMATTATTGIMEITTDGEIVGTKDLTQMTGVA
jgi:hypothetical protein